MLPGTENADAISDNIIFGIKNTKIHGSIFIKKRQPKEYQNFLAKDLNDQHIGKNIKKTENENTKKQVYIFSQIKLNRLFNVNLTYLTDYLFSFIQTKITREKGVKLKDITKQKILQRIITPLSIEKTSMSKVQIILLDVWLIKIS